VKFHSLVGVAVLLMIWELVSGLKLLDRFFLPGPTETLAELCRLVASGLIVPDLLATLGRVGFAFAVALAGGVPLGLILGGSERVYRSVEFIVDFFRSTPSTAIFPLFLLIFGIGDAAKIAVAAFGAALIIIFNTAYGLIHANRARILAVKLMGASRFQMFNWVLLWESLPQTFVGMRAAVSLALVIVIVTEMFIGTPVGLGRLIIDYELVYNVKAMYAAIIIAGIVGYSLNLILLEAEKRLVHWTGH
jgi:sulfonate transport system permease protein